MTNRTFDALIVGSGAAGFAAACRLAQKGKNVAIVTEGRNMGTSRNTGSDKQTYYKSGIGNETDSVRNMALDLFRCGCTDGDTALIEAACSTRCFFYLNELGVPFPHTEYGEYIGYKTDHDPCARASSAGPLTSKYMTEALERQAEILGIPVFDKMYVNDVLFDEAGICGLCAVNCETGELAAFKSRNVILATGGPAGIYARSVYPKCHTGSTSLALRAGVKLQNLTEWQYGLASIAPRWNVSGSYMQVIPRFISIDKDGSQKEFLTDYFWDTADAVNAVFLKGYQWPFDAKKAKEGSSRVDLAVYSETVKRGKRVFLDYTKNPFGYPTFESLPLSEEAKTYLSGANVKADTPIGRLNEMNEPAVKLFKSKGIDLSESQFEIALCAQHCNGGVSVNCDWETEIPGLFAIGECAGTHGITRPGGSALNAGQVGALRAAERISAVERDTIDETGFDSLVREKTQQHVDFCEKALYGTRPAEDLLFYVREKFDSVCSAVRNVKDFTDLKEELTVLLDRFGQNAKIRNTGEAADAYRLRDALTVQLAMLTACENYTDTVNGSRGSAVYPTESSPSSFILAGNDASDRIQQINMRGNRFFCSFRPVRPIPDEERSFEKMWKQFREKN